MTIKRQNNKTFELDYYEWKKHINTMRLVEKENKKKLLLKQSILCTWAHFLPWIILFNCFCYAEAKICQKCINDSRVAACNEILVISGFLVIFFPLFLMNFPKVDYRIIAIKKSSKWFKSLDTSCYNTKKRHVSKE